MNDAPSRDFAVVALFCTGLPVVVLNVMAVIFFSAFGPSFLPLLQTAMALTAIFALAGFMVMLMRAPRLGRTGTRRR
ncbi:hypothetical protein [Novosphingobium lindaniclasticum]